MYFIGSGSLLIRAVTYAVKKGIGVKEVFVPDRDSYNRLVKLEVNAKILENPAYDLKTALAGKDSSIIFSINNELLISNEILTLDHKFFNIHNGLVQKYRGIAEICILAAIKNKETNYGVTLHQILPNQRVDSGPVVDQIIFDIKDLSFEGIIKQSFNELVNIFELNIDTIINDQFSLNEVALSSKSYSYSDLNELCINFSGAEIKKIFNLGSLSMFFPKLKTELDKIIKNNE